MSEEGKAVGTYLSSQYQHRFPQHCFRVRDFLFPGLRHAFLHCPSGPGISAPDMSWGVCSQDL